MVSCRSQVVIHILKTVPMVTASKPQFVSAVPFCVTPGLVSLADSDIVLVELTNTTREELVLEPNALIGELHQVTIADNVSACDAEFLEQFDLGSLDISNEHISELSNILLEHKGGFACNIMVLLKSIYIQ